MAILYPVGIVDTYPYFHFQTLQSLTLHGLLLFVPLAMVLFQGFRPSLKKFWQVPAVLMGSGVPGLFGGFYLWGELHVSLLRPARNPFGLVLTPLATGPT